MEEMGAVKYIYLSIFMLSWGKMASGDLVWSIFEEVNGDSLGMIYVLWYGVTCAFEFQGERWYHDMALVKASSALPSVTLLPSSLILERGLVSPESKAVLMVWTKPVFDKVGVGGGEETKYLFRI